MNFVEKILILLFSLSAIFFFTFLYTSDIDKTFKIVFIFGIVGFIFIVVSTGIEKKIFNIKSE